MCCMGKGHFCFQETHRACVYQHSMSSGIMSIIQAYYADCVQVLTIFIIHTLFGVQFHDGVVYVDVIDCP